MNRISFLNRGYAFKGLLAVCHLRTVLLSVNMDVMSGNLKISLRLTHIFVVYNAIPTCVLG